MKLVLLGTMAFISCQHRLPVENIDSVQLKQDQPTFFNLNQATLIFNGQVLTERLSLTQADFGFFFLWVKNEGLFAVTIFPISISVPAGDFIGNRMLVEYRGHRIELINGNKHIFADGKDRGAYLVHVRDFNIFGPDVKPANTVIGAVTELSQIPRWSN